MPSLNANFKEINLKTSLLFSRVSRQVGQDLCKPYSKNTIRESHRSHFSPWLTWVPATLPALTPLCSLFPVMQRKIELPMLSSFWPALVVEGLFFCQHQIFQQRTMKDHFAPRRISHWNEFPREHWSSNGRFWPEGIAGINLRTECCPAYAIWKISVTCVAWPFYHSFRTECIIVLNSIRWNYTSSTNSRYEWPLL